MKSGMRWDYVIVVLKSKASGAGFDDGVLVNNHDCVATWDPGGHKLDVVSSVRYNKMPLSV